MTLKHLFTVLAITSCTLFGLTSCDDEDYAPISLEILNGAGHLENNVLQLDAFSPGESFLIVGGNGRYIIENQSKDIVDYRYDGHSLTFIPVGVGKATVVISDHVGSRMTLTIEVKNHTEIFNVTGLEAKAYGTNMTMGEVATLERQIVNESLIKIGGNVVLTYTNREQSLGSITIYPTPSGRPISGIFRQEEKFDATKAKYLEFTITLADNRVIVWQLFNYNNEEGKDMMLQENMLETYKGKYPLLEKASLTYKITY